MHPLAVLPYKASPGAAGYDLTSVDTVVIPPGGSALVSTGWSMMLPQGTYGRIAPRSGLAVKHAIGVGAGVIDRDYRGVVGVVLFNHGTSHFHISQGDRIAQLILEKIVEDVEFTHMETVLEATERGENGFGSTGS